MLEFFSAFSSILQPNIIIYIFLGTLAGVLVGSMPGLSSIMGLSILMPFTFSLGGDTGILMLLGMFCGSIFGGSVTAILINTPGTANSAATCLDGYPMANKYGQPGRALSISIMASTFGGIFSAVMLLFTSPILAKFALRFGSPEFFALAIFGLSIVAGISSKSLVKGLISTLIGLLLATVGINSFTGEFRFTFDSVYLSAGISFVPVLIALYAFSQGLAMVESGESSKKASVKVNKVFPSIKDVKRVSPTILRSSFLGTVIGTIPGTGGDIASWVGYNEAKRWSKNPEKFGDGAPEGIAAPEAANNAISGGALIPLLTLGIPGDAGTAIMLGALMMQGIIPGPLLFEQQTEKVYIIIGGLILANIFMCIIGYCGVKYFSKITTISSKILTPIIFIFCFVGTFSINNNVNDIYFMIIAGIIGYILIKNEFPLPPIILGLILGGIAEKNLERSLALSEGDLMIFIERPISLTLLIVALISMIYPIIHSKIRKRKSIIDSMDSGKDL
ncbi:tripartite tricarboxylate transporter permease [Radiobacillus sp. PE A8.2]|uniref:tripartite tricarboxylate transporter permease n=1 Tax=Radiobacillus sp. PE A8.2 TaxID=3380349 RepID=UPI00388FEEF4